MPAVPAPRETELGGPLKETSWATQRPNTNKTKLSRKQVIHHRKKKKKIPGDVKDLGVHLCPQSKRAPVHAAARAAQKILAKTSKSKLKNI